MQDFHLTVKAARAGAEVVRRWAGRIGGPEYKARNDPVTEADHAAQAAIVELLHAERPDDAVIGEEGDSGVAGRARRWLVDPLDGTVNFISGIPHVGVSVALYEGERAIAAAVIDVFHGDEFTAAAGQGAHRNGEPMRVSGRETLQGAVVGTGFPYDHTVHDYTPPLRAVLGKVQGVRRFGAAALDLAWVACGRLDGFWELGLSPWDLAAGLLLIREAGGSVTGLGGEQATPETSLMVASNGLVHEELLELVAGNLPDHLTPKGRGD